MTSRHFKYFDRRQGARHLPIAGPGILPVSAKSPVCIRLSLPTNYAKPERRYS